MSDHDTFVVEALKAFDPERFLCCLYLPEEIRTLAITLYTFDSEIARIPDLVSEPMPGEIRVQWWRDLIKSGGNAGSGPLAEALLQQIKTHNLPIDVLDNLLEARIFDLYHDPMPDTETYEGYLGETQSALLNMIVQAGGAERGRNLADCCGHAGVAIGMARHLSSLAKSRTQQKLFLPLPTLKKHDLTRETWFQDDASQHIKVIEEHILAAKLHLEKAETALVDLPKEFRSVFLPIKFVSPLLDKIAKKPSELLHRPVTLSPLKRQWLAFRGVSEL